MKTQKAPLSVMFSGYGHYKVTTTYYGKEISCTTTDMPSIDDFNSDEHERDGRELRKLRGYKSLRSECIRENSNY
jgi:hypothetical protein